MWRYNVSHGQLLLRSTKTPELPTRIDILFKGVAAVKLATGMSSLTVRSPTPAEAENIEAEFPRAMHKGDEIFVLSSKAGVGYVIAVAMHHTEDDGEYYDPNHVFSNL
jgi:hypothetical protein